MKKAAETIIDCLKEKRMSQSQLARAMGEDVRIVNQQLHRHNDMKVERFIDVLEHIGYRIEIVENDGICKVSKEYAMQIIKNRKPAGLFWYIDNEIVVGIDNRNSDARIHEFCNKEECFKWLKGKI